MFCMLFWFLGKVIHGRIPDGRGRSARQTTPHPQACTAQQHWEPQDHVAHGFRDNSPHRNSPHDNSPHDSSPHVQLSPQTACPMDSTPRGQFAPWTTRTMDSRPIDNSPHGQLAPWTTCPTAGYLAILTILSDLCQISVSEACTVRNVFKFKFSLFFP